MSTKRQNRTTKQVRILDQIHHQLKFFAAERGSTISKLVDGLLIFAMEEKAGQDELKQQRWIKRQHKQNAVAIMNAQRD